MRYTFRRLLFAHIAAIYLAYPLSRFVLLAIYPKTPLVQVVPGNLAPLLVAPLLFPVSACVMPIQSGSLPGGPSQYALLLACYAAPFIATFVVVSRPVWKTRGWGVRRKCLDCGYDLRSSRYCCPECGTPINEW